MAHTRYIQIDNAHRLRKRRDIPYFSKKKGAWCYADKTDTSLERLVQVFAEYELKFRYRYDGEIITRRSFFEVLIDMVDRYDDLDINGFEEDYNHQQIEWLSILKEKLKAGKKLPSDADCIEDAIEELTYFAEIYQFLVKKNQSVNDCWHAHVFDTVLYRALDMPDFSIAPFKDQYSRQQLELLNAIKNKLQKRR